MKRFQFSLSFLLAAMLFIGALVSILIQFASFGVEAAFEQFLCVVWLLLLLTAYCRSTARGAKRIFRTTMITGAIWSVTISTYLLFSLPMRVYPIYRGSSAEILMHALAVSVVGVAAALLGASLLEMIVFAAQRWRSAALRTRMACSAVMIAIAIAVALWWSAERSRLWKPSVATLDAVPIAESDLAGKFIQRLAQGNYLSPDGQNVLPLGHYVLSPDGRFVANLAGTWIQVFEVATSNMTASFEAPSGQWFVTMTFLSDSSGLVAIPAVPKTSGTHLFRWRTDTWEEQDRLSLGDLKNHSGRGETFPILTDHVLLLVYINDDNPAQTQLEFSTAELLDDCRTVSHFASLTANLAKQIDKSTFSNPEHPSFWISSHPPLWKVSPDRACIVSAPHVFERDYRWVFGRGSDRILKFQGDPLEFLSGDDRVIIWEWSWQRIARSHVQAAGHVPPFWNPPWEGASYYRVSVLNSQTGERFARSGWWRCEQPSWDPARGVVRAAYQNGSLFWDPADTLRRP